MTSTKFKELNNIVSNEIKNKFPVGKRNLYTYVEKGYLDIINLDLPRKVRYKKRKRNNVDTPKKDTKIRINCTYEHFKDYIKNYNDNNFNIVKMDTVEDIKGE